jgi:hypothetical protein
VDLQWHARRPRIVELCSGDTTVKEECTPGTGTRLRQRLGGKCTQGETCIDEARGKVLGERRASIDDLGDANPLGVGVTLSSRSANVLPSYKSGVWTK